MMGVTPAMSAIPSTARSGAGGNGVMRIGLDGDTLGRRRTGDESYLVGLMRGLAAVDGGNEYVVYVRDADAARSMFTDGHSFDFHAVTPRSIWLRFAYGLARAVRRDPIDLLHVQYFAPPRTRTPVVVTAHDISFAVHPEYFTTRDRLLLGRLVPWSLRRADRIITDAEFTRGEMVRVYGFDPAGIEVIPLAADPRYRPLDRERCRATLAERHGTHDGFILYVGTLQPRKNVATLVEAYAAFRRRSGLRHKLVITGRPKYQFSPVFEAIRRSGFEEDVVFTGWVADDDIPMYYNAADVFVFATLYEGFGLPVLEAMSCGTAVICSDNSCLPETAGSAAMLVNPRAAESITEAMLRVLTDPVERARLEAAGLRRAAEFNWERTAMQTLAVYRDVLARRRN